MDPLIVIIVLQDVVVRNQFVYPGPRRFNDGQEPHRFMIGHIAVHHSLPGQSEPEIAPGTGHDADTSHHIVIDLAPAAIDLVVDRRKIMLHIDPLGHDLRGGQEHFQQPVVRIFPVVVGMQKDAPAQIEPLSEFPSTDDKGRIP